MGKYIIKDEDLDNEVTHEKIRKKHKFTDENKDSFKKRKKK